MRNMTFWILQTKIEPKNTRIIELELLQLFQ